MYTQTPRHPRAGLAAGLAILAAWLGALGIAFATDDSADRERGAGPAARTVVIPSDVGRERR
jgi:hypothetical protein